MLALLRRNALPLLLLTLLAIAPGAFGQEEVAAEAVAEVTVEAVAESAALAMFTVNNTWMLVATFLVFIMHLGFACLEVGLTRAKNTVNILFKNKEDQFNS